MYIDSCFQCGLNTRLFPKFALGAISSVIRANKKLAAFAFAVDINDIIQIKEQCNRLMEIGKSLLASTKYNWRQFTIFETFISLLASHEALKYKYYKRQK
jgi:hypothetical protein